MERRCVDHEAVPHVGPAPPLVRLRHVSHRDALDERREAVCRAEVAQWPAYRNASDADLKSIYAFLRTIKPVANHVPDVQPAPGLAH